MINFNFKNKKVTFHKLDLFAKKANLDLKECLNEAFNQNALIDDNIDFLTDEWKTFTCVDSTPWKKHKIKTLAVNNDTLINTSIPLIPPFRACNGSYSLTSKYFS